MEQRVMERRAVRAWFDSPLDDRRRTGYERRGQMKPSAAPGAIRPAHDQPIILKERRGRPESGTE